MSPKSLKITVDRLPEFRRAIKELTGKVVLVGIPSSTAERQPDPDDPHPLNNAEIGYLMENGSPAANIPARPFLEPGVIDAKDKIAAAMRAGAAGALEGQRGAAEKALVAAGLVAERGVKARITDGPFAPLAPSTLADRKARGRTGEKPLVDTGQLRNSVTSVVRAKGDL